MFWRKCSQETIDARVLDAARKNLRHVERWGRWWAGLHWAVATVYVVVLIAFCSLVVDMGKNLAGANRAELWFGFIFGMLVAGMLYKLSSSIVTASLSRLPDERDRLLVRYHDALREILDGAARPAGEIDADHGDDAPDPKPRRNVPVDHLN